MRTCKRCGKEKDESEFPKHKLYVRYVCRDCEKPNSGRIKKGTKPQNGFQKGHVPWCKGLEMSAEFKRKCGLKNIGRVPTEEHRKKQSLTTRGRGKGRISWNYKEWKRKVFERDGYKCVKCGASENLHAHHIVPWQLSEELRFDVDNGKALCNICHAKLEGFQKGHVSENGFEKGHIPWTKGKKFPGKINSGCFEKGQKSWNKGIPMPEEVKIKVSEAKKGKVSWNKGIPMSTEAKRKLCESFAKKKKPLPAEKECKVCGIMKPIEKFVKSKCGYLGKCKECRNFERREHYKERKRCK